MRWLNEPHPVVLRPPLVDLADESLSLAAVFIRLRVLERLDGLFAVSPPSACDGEDQDSGVGGGRGSRFVLKTSARTDLDLFACVLFLRWFSTFFLGASLLFVCAFSAASACCSRARCSCGSRPPAAAVSPDDVPVLANEPQAPTPVLENAPGNAFGCLEGPSSFAELLRHAVLESDRVWQENTALRSGVRSRNVLNGRHEAADIDNVRSCCDPVFADLFCRQNAHTKGLLRSCSCMMSVIAPGRTELSWGIRAANLPRARPQHCNTG